ncbi:MAG: aldehyde dehydrogenase family protein [Acidobacteriota bacterium]|nr:aldehyde dehydrogenase family protein [Acidobacteriota bacterium]MDH3524210.1 aldehyde dehydrogenase family protein [Acidobacteriota bacterium]
MTDAANAAALRPELPPARLWLGGEWVEPEGGRTFTSENPATEEVLCEVASASAADVDRAVAAARGALAGEWGATSARERGKLLWRLADALEERIQDFAVVETLDNGKPIFESRYVDMPSVVDCLRYYAGWADKVAGETLASSGPIGLTYTLREPVGAVGAITPWNFPLLLAAWKIAPALACGNVVIHKPASLTSLTALMLGALAAEVGFPAGVLNVLPGGGSEVGGTMVGHPGIDKIAFTGSTAVGIGIAKQAADTVKRLGLELGGKSANIVFADSDLDAAAKGAFNGIFYGKGEVCAAGSRLLVERTAHDELLEKLVARTERLQPADPLHPKTRLGALVSKEQRDSVLGYVEKGRREGAEVATGGAAAAVDGKGYFMQPTVLTGVDNAMTVAREEIFGPVLVTIPFDDAEEAVALANASVYGLAAGVWTRDVGKAHHVAARLQAGTVWINQYNWYDAGAPFGGYKQSGYGRELGRQALDYYTETKTVFVGK